MSNLQKIKHDCRAAREAFARAHREHFALGAFNLDNQETLIAVVRAALAKKAPVLVEVSQGEVEAMGLDNIRDMVDNYKTQYGIEMYINLDHSPSVENAIAGIEAGFECIHIDISQANHNAPREEIIRGTRKIVEAARKTGALVEGEEHYFMGSSNLHTEKIDYAEVKKLETNPASAADFVKRTGIDTFAAQVGNLHGAYPVPKHLDLDLLRQIRSAIDCNISLHGGSDTPPHYFIEAVKIGATKININSDMRVAYRQTLEKVLDENKTEYAVVKLMGQVIEAVQRVVETKIDMFNAAGKVRP
ncbi:TPA: ketose-bisphosphate aldolase [Candidatus Saccharibacteria bacterium]|nr:MAG: Ketose-bisphosphate aldolase, class-II [Candidatus Saccharibacteria bacterium GW2011_GWA2_46_10]OGL35023.1 MAG: ketose-bisphosphate aldolase [Candidatus Saccharibacteria bacterium RIFCSPHIGHO2_12_FULL_47_17]HCM51657.1 ketose-bisphosphate aldolase [Candidatus Saccharibacteria bacterium]